MEIYVACDVCGHRYTLPEERLGRSAKCKSCGVSFEIRSDNFYDPETTEFDEEDEDDDEGGSVLSPVWAIAKKIGHAASGLVTLAMLYWMSTLLFRSPKDALAQNGRLPANPVKPHQQHQQPFQPNFTPRTPSTGVTPTPNVNAGPPAADGSMGWPQGPGQGPPGQLPPGMQQPPGIPGMPAPPGFADFHIGQFVEVQKDGGWVRAVIRQLEANGNLRVLYLGRPGRQEESVSRDKVRRR
jgi:hypothetical protein